MILNKIFGIIGAEIGSSFGGGIITRIGRFAGNFLGNYLEGILEDNTYNKHYSIYHGKIVGANREIKANVCGSVIPVVYGKGRVDGKLIWSIPLKFSVTQNENNIYYKYHATFALGICEGEVKNLGRVWVGDKVLDISKYNYRFYSGNSTQMPDPIIQKHHEQAPAFRDLCYIVFEELPLDDFNNKIPEFSFEVKVDCNYQQEERVESKIKGINIIPGTGEFVYDTIVQTKKISINTASQNIEINCHNHQKIADSVFSLNQLQSCFTNLEWVSVVVCWFGDSLDIKTCSILPCVEFSDLNTSEEWKVENFSRKNAKVISHDRFDTPNYGGTVNDASLVRYIAEIKSRGLKVMLYPMFFIDLPHKPWRGHLTGLVEDIDNFFLKEDGGYNAFILHYANLLKGSIDAFVIGSEMKGITSIHQNGVFYGVDHLINLAKSVREVLNSQVLITYAADWSEYHQTDGWFKMDPLWSSEFIDIIGIDAYFPITNTTVDVTKQMITRGWSSGEGYDFYLQNESQESLEPLYAWKNLEYWWSNFHFNPDGKKSSWSPRQKKIWFTEYGFPSIDKATNQPNIFYDPKCFDGGIPKNSRGLCDFNIQKDAINESLDTISKMDFITNAFLWCWDARPYPSWPHGNFWTDGDLWQKGHWVNGKLDMIPLKDILFDLFKRCNLKVDFLNLASDLEGMVINDSITIFDLLQILRLTYFFDINPSFDKVVCIGRSFNNFSELNINALSNEKITTQPLQNMLGEVILSYIDSTKDFQKSFAIENSTPGKRKILKIPIVFSGNQASVITRKILSSIQSETHTLNLNFIEGNFEVGQTVSFMNKKMRILEVLSSQNSTSIQCIVL